MSSRTIKSYWGVELSPRFIDAGGKKLCVILPGIGYCLDRSYLDYSKQLAKEIGYDILEVEYGYQINRSEFNLEKEFSIMVSESLEVIDNAIEKDYEEVLIIGKSIGTSVQYFLNEDLGKRFKNIRNIYISPINKTLNEFNIEPNSLVITGNEDPLLSIDNRMNIENRDDVETFVIEGGNHALDIEGNVMKTVDDLKESLQIEKEFILR
ncbi:alpha/beta hydrolase [Clostridium sp. LIBA-8841]|uniref:alpha/beta hydrolase n=1 Tax=Clostridium sp. LIBA-8841 TaxID=2987530 RepID=UPI002AC5DFA1|nr:alpha/beta hydrolase [Clostridium sp. LIBA-8841]MDZ5252441.1 alpha/beta hydrolase [Clostridium sp. LIBA-8841]